MIITRTPFRISFVGGGSDLRDFYIKHQGAVLSTSINKYMYISSHKYFEEDKIRAKYSQTETVQNIEDLKHEIIREALKLANIRGGVEVSSIADIPAGTGMGSSSAFTVGLLHNLNAIKRHYASKEMLAEEACRMEIDVLKEPIGKQDQYAAAFGGLNIFRFNANETVTVEPLYLKQDVYNQLQDNLLLFFIGNERKASEILVEQKNNIANADKFAVLKDMVALVDVLKDVLYKGSLDEFGQLLHQNWLLKQRLASKISNNYIEDLYQLGIKNGAAGGKLLGAGGGGFMLFYCPKEMQQNLIKAMPVRHFDFKFDNEGTKLIYFGDEWA
jgi:D-glycero-alpha-D-manno-heptose-7-phosphate kinase